MCLDHRSVFSFVKTFLKIQVPYTIVRRRDFYKLVYIETLNKHSLSWKEQAIVC